MLSQRIYGLALGYEDLNDHEQLRHDPLMAVLAGRRKLEEPLAGKSTLNRLELTGRSLRYHKIAYSAEAVDRPLTDHYLESHPASPDRIVLDLDATDIPRYGTSRSGSSTATSTATATCRCISSPATSCCARICGQPTRTRLPARLKSAAHRCSGALTLARCKDRAARRLRLLPRGTDALVRAEQDLLCPRTGAEQAAAQDHRRPIASGSGPAPEHG
jgi:hypothetical protein